MVERSVTEKGVEEAEARIEVVVAAEEVTIAIAARMDRVSAPVSLRLIRVAVRESTEPIELTDPVEEVRRLYDNSIMIPIYLLVFVVYRMEESNVIESKRKVETSLIYYSSKFWL